MRDDRRVRARRVPAARGWPRAAFARTRASPRCPGYDRPNPVHSAQMRRLTNNKHQSQHPNDSTVSMMPCVANNVHLMLVKRCYRCQVHYVR